MQIESLRKRLDTSHLLCRYFLSVKLTKNIFFSREATTTNYLVRPSDMTLARQAPIPPRRTDLLLLLGALRKRMKEQSQKDHSVSSILFQERFSPKFSTFFPTRTRKFAEVSVCIGYRYNNAFEISNREEALLSLITNMDGIHLIQKVLYESTMPWVAMNLQKKKKTISKLRTPSHFFYFRC